jgi:glucokinase
MLVGIDIGATKTVALAVGKDGSVRGRSKKRTKAREPEAILERAEKAAREAVKEAGASFKKVRRVGIGVPAGVLDGVARLAPQLGWQDVPVRELAEGIFGRQVVVENDVNLGLVGEFHEANLGPLSTACAFFFGTGMGGAVIVDGRILRGGRGLAGELGHIIVEPGGRACGCGNAGCLEAYASKTALLARIKSALFDEGRESALRDEISPDDRVVRSSVLKKAWDAGDDLAREVVEEGMRYFGLGVASMMNGLDPDLVVLGGGVVEAFGDEMVESVKDQAAPHLFADRERISVVRRTALGDDAVALGAAYVARTG